MLTKFRHGLFFVLEVVLLGVIGTQMAYATNCYVGAESADIYKQKGSSIYLEEENVISDSDDCRHKVLIEKGGVPGRVTKHVSYRGCSSLLMQVPSSFLGVSGSEYIKNRSEFQLAYKEDLIKDHWYKFSVLFPASFTPPDNWFLFSQVWQQKARNPLFAIEIYKDQKINMVLRNEEYHRNAMHIFEDTEEVPKGVWISFIVNLKASLKDEGKVQVWMKKGEACYKKVVNKTGVSIGKFTDATGKKIPMGSKFVDVKVGIYRGSSSIDHKLYFDEMQYTDHVPDYMSGIRVCE